MADAKVKNPLKAVYVVKEELEKNVYETKGMATLVWFEKGMRLVTWSGAIKANGRNGTLIAERFSGHPIGAYQLKVSIFWDYGNFTFLKIDSHSNKTKTSNGKDKMPTYLNFEVPKDVASNFEASSFVGSRDFKLSFKYKTNTGNHEVEAKGVDLLSVIGAPFISKCDGGKYSVVGLVGLTEEKNICPYFVKRDLFGTATGGETSCSKEVPSVPQSANCIVPCKKDPGDPACKDGPTINQNKHNQEQGAKDFQYHRTLKEEKKRSLETQCAGSSKENQGGKDQSDSATVVKAHLRMQIDVEAFTEGSAQEGAGMQVHPQQHQEVFQEETEHFGKKTNQSTQAVLDKIADKYLQGVSPSNVEEFNAFKFYLEEMRKVLVIDVKPGCLIVTVEVGSEKILEELWKDYREGHLNEVAQKFLVTEELLVECGLTELKLTIHIAEEEYKACKRYFCAAKGSHDQRTLEEEKRSKVTQPGGSSKENQGRKTNVGERDQLHSGTQTRDNTEPANAPQDQRTLKEEKGGGGTQPGGRLSKENEERKTTDGQPDKPDSGIQPSDSTEPGREEEAEENTDESDQEINTGVEETDKQKKNLSGLRPTDLRSSRLSTNVLHIPGSVYRAVCIKLNSKDEMFFNDYRMLCEDLGYNDTVARGLEQSTTSNPTNELLWNWSTRDADEATVGKLINLLKDKELNRMDVVKILEDWKQEDPYFSLSTRVIDIPRHIKGRICRKLNIEDTFYRDYRMLAEKLNYKRDHWEGLKQGKADPTDTLIRMWCKANGPLTVSRLIELLKGKREDVVMILEDWVNGLKAC